MLAALRAGEGYDPAYFSSLPKDQFSFPLVFEGGSATSASSSAYRYSLRNVIALFGGASAGSSGLGAHYVSYRLLSPSAGLMGHWDVNVKQVSVGLIVG